MLFDFNNININDVHMYIYIIIKIGIKIMLTYAQCCIDVLPGAGFDYINMHIHDDDHDD